MWSKQVHRVGVRDKVEPGAQLRPQLSTGNHGPCRPLSLGLALARQTPWASDTHLAASSINSCTRPDLPETPDKHWLLSGHTAAPEKGLANVLYFFPEPELLSDSFLGRERELSVKVTLPSPPKSFVCMIKDTHWHLLRWRTGSQTPTCGSHDQQ